MRALCLDIATRTGWCVSLAGVRLSGAVDLAARGGVTKKTTSDEKTSLVLPAFWGWLDEMLELHAFDHIVIESDISRGSPLLNYLQGVAITWAGVRGVGCLSISQSMWRKAVLGKGAFRDAPGEPKQKVNANKRAALAHVVLHLPEIGEDHDRAEAICIAEFAETVIQTAAAA